jgi:hypothetical protein
MAWDVRRTYLYLVCFATLLMVIIGGVQVVQRTLDLLMPPEPYRPNLVEMHRGPAGIDTLYSLEELERRSDAQVEQERARMRRDALRGLLGSLALVLIAAPVYAYHWRQTRTAPD